MFRYVIAILIICCMYVVSANAFNDTVTHRRLTEQAIKASNLNTYLAQFVGYSSGVKKILNGKDRIGNNKNFEVDVWFQEGSTDEDKLNSCRASSHFHNPIFISTDPNIKDWDGSKMSDSLVIDAWCMLAAKRYSTVTFATGFRSPTGPYIVRDGQGMGWDNARSYFYEALTTTDPVAKEEKFIRTFRAVGMVMHLLQDMAVPAHVRNDMSSHLVNKPWWDFSRWASNPFEKYVFNNDRHMNVIMSTTTDSDKPVFSAPMRHTDFWDKDIYTGENPDDTLGPDIGLAEYINANFVSDFTMFKPQSDTKHYFKYPSETTSVGKAHYIIADPIKPGQTIKRTYYQKIMDGDVGYRLAGVGFLNRWSASLTPLKRISPMDDNVHDDYAKKILPRAVGYSASLLDYFFRGNIKVTTVNPTDISFRSVKVNVQNNTPGETMGVGEVKLIIRYKALSEWPLVGNKLQLNYPPEDNNPDKYTYKVSIPQYVDLTNPQTLTFDFSTDTLPYFFNDMTMQLVFKGKLGNEEGAVAVSQLEPINSVYSDFTVSLPASGVYAKAADNTLSATFNELRVNAQTDIPAGLTGGSFELALEYRKAATDPFQSVPVETEPADAVAYVIRVPEKNGVSILQPGTPVELAFDLSSALLPVSATDVYLNIIYKNSGTSKIMAVGLKDISEPTPVDIFNNTDRVCIGNQWYVSGSPEAYAAVGVDIYGDPLDDIFSHRMDNISFWTAGSGTLNLPLDPAARNLAISGANPGEVTRLGYILTNYTSDFAFDEQVTPLDPRDDWTMWYDNKILSGTGFTNQADRGFSGMYTIRGNKLWWGASVIYDLNDDSDSLCGWERLQ